MFFCFFVFLFFCFFSCHLRLSQRRNDPVVGWFNLFVVITLYQQQPIGSPYKMTYLVFSFNMCCCLNFVSKEQSASITNTTKESLTICLPSIKIDKYESWMPQNQMIYFVKQGIVTQTVKSSLNHRVITLSIKCSLNHRVCKRDSSFVEFFSNWKIGTRIFHQRPDWPEK